MSIERYGTQAKIFCYKKNSFGEELEGEINIEFETNIKEKADFKLQLNFQKLGSYVGSKMPLILKALKTNDWKIVNEKLIETADNIGAIKVFFADGKQIDKKVAEANKKAMEKYFSDRLTIAGGKEIDRKVAEANKKIAEANI